GLAVSEHGPKCSSLSGRTTRGFPRIGPEFLPGARDPAPPRHRIGAPAPEPLPRPPRPLLPSCTPCPLQGGARCPQKLPDEPPHRLAGAEGIEGRSAPPARRAVQPLRGCPRP